MDAAEKREFELARLRQLRAPTVRPRLLAKQHGPVRSVLWQLVCGAVALTSAAVGATVFLALALPSPSPQSVVSSPGPGAQQPRESMAADAPPTAYEMAPGNQERSVTSPETTAASVAAPAAAMPSVNPSPALALAPESGPSQTPAENQEQPSATPALSAPQHAAAGKTPGPPQVVVQLSSYADQAKAQEAAGKLERSLRSVLNGIPVETQRAALQGRIVWRVVAGPIASRERGQRLCEAVRNAGQSCIVVLL